MNLDKTSEKVLKYLISHCENIKSKSLVTFTPEDAGNVNLPFSLFCGSCELLEKAGYITELAIYYEEDGGRLLLTFAGYSYFDYKRIEKQEFYKQLAISKISDIVVSAIVALITALLAA